MLMSHLQDLQHNWDPQSPLAHADMQVTEVAIFMNRPANTSKGCGFISFSTRDQAQAAIDNLHDKKVMDVSLRWQS